MKMAVTGWMQHDEIVISIPATIGASNQMMNMPTTFRSYAYLTYRTHSPLRRPEAGYFLSSFQGILHFKACTFLKIRFPQGIKGVRFKSDFPVTNNPCIYSFAQ